MKDALAQQPVKRQLLLVLLGLLSLLVVPHAWNLSPWIVGLFFLTAAWRLAAIWRPGLLPSRWLLFLLMILGIGNVLVNAGLGDGRLAGTALLVVMLGLKLLELRTRRDVFVCVFLGFFVVMTQFLYSNNLGLALYLLALTVLLVSVLLALNRVEQDPVHSLISTFVLLITALPVALVLFVVFPRLDTPLWAIQSGNSQGRTGISDTLRLGSIEQLSTSTAVAFHARFEGEAPPPEDRYWRGLVLTHFDGNTWRYDHSRLAMHSLEVDPESRYDYQLTLEPHQQTWLFPLAMPLTGPAKTFLNRDYQLSSRGPVSKRQSFDLSAYTRYRALAMDAQMRQEALALPEDLSPRVQQLAQQWRSLAGDQDRQVVRSALLHFREQPFVYTLSPGRVVGDPVEYFLFESRRGFCEHYAASFTLLMRAAGIPARLVVGYQGGEYNPRADHLTIRQSDAHAWAEVWLGEQQGWQRVDPTAAVAPERIEQGINPRSSAAAGDIVFGELQLGLWRWLQREAGWLVDAADLGWHRWILGFDKNRQRRLLRDLGLESDDIWVQAGSALAALGAGAALVFLFGSMRKKTRLDPVQREWAKLMLRLRRAGLEVPVWAGPLQVVELVSNRWPSQERQIGYLAKLYVHLRYARVQRRGEKEQFRQAVRKLALK